MSSEPGDWVGSGLQYLYTDKDGTFTATHLNSNAVNLGFDGGSDWWYLDFAAPSGQALAATQYLNATRYPFQATNEPGLSVHGMGRGCNTLTGEFTVLEVTLGPADEVISFHATFIQHCEGDPEALTGEIMFSTTGGIPVAEVSWGTMKSNFDD